MQSGNSFSVHQLFDLSDHLQLKVPDMRLFIDQLNDAGMIFYIGIRTSCAVSHCCLCCFTFFVAIALMSLHMVGQESCCVVLSAVQQDGMWYDLAGELLKKGPQTYALQSVPVDVSQPATSQVSRYSAASQSVNNS